MNKHKVIAIAAIIANFGVLASLEGGAITPLTAVVLIIPMEALMIWSLDHSGWIDTDAVEADKLAMIAAVKDWCKGVKK